MTTSWLRRCLYLGIAIASLTAGCGGDDEPETVIGALEGGEEVAELVTGEPFEATAVVDDVVSPQAFYLLDTLVVSADASGVVEDERVVVTGEITEADPEVVEDLLGVPLDDEARAALDDVELVVVASRIEETDNTL